MNADLNGMTAERPDSGDDTLRMTGRVKRPFLIRTEQLRAMETEEIEDLLIICGTGDPKGRIRNCKGVLLENVLRMAEVLREEEDDTKKMYIVVSAKDGYKVVFSWQEIMNTSIGGGVMILLERDGKTLDGEHGELELISAEDYYTGSRYVKQIRNIEVVLVQ